MLSGFMLWMMIMDNNRWIKIEMKIWEAHLPNARVISMKKKSAAQTCHKIGWLPESWQIQLQIQIQIQEEVPEVQVVVWPPQGRQWMQVQDRLPPSFPGVRVNDILD